MPEALRFLFVGRFSPAPKGERITVSGERMADVMKRLDLRAVVEVADRLGALPSRRYELELSSARALRVADVCADIEPLRSLAEIANGLVRSSGALALPDAIARVRTLVGDGPLTLALGELAQPATPTAAPSPAPGTAAVATGATGPSAVDAIFAQADVASPDTVAAARSGLDAFVGAMRKHKPEAATKPTAPGHRASALILDAIEAAAADALGHEPAASIEASWRGLKLVLGESPGHARLAIELLDVDAAERLEVLAHALERGPVDAVFVVDAPDELGGHARLAALGAETQTPMVVTLDPSLLDVGHSPLSEWVALRGDGHTEWLCAATNDVVLACEQTRVGPRVVFGAPVFVVAAMLAASLRRDGTFGDAFGRAGAVVGPASWPIDAGRGTTRNVPVRASLGVDAMRAMLASGITVLGSEPGGERLLAIGAPMVHKVEGPSLAGKILVGRAVHRARHAKAGLAHGAGPTETAAALERAASEVLPDGPPGACSLRGRTEGSDLAIVAEFRAEATGRAFGASFRV